MIYDITVEINPDLPIWPGDPKIRIERLQKLEEGAAANVSRLEMGLHTGTHVDAPYHFLADGADLGEIELERFIGPVSVIEVSPQVDVLSDGIIAQIPEELFSERMLFKTRNSRFWSETPPTFHREFVAIDLSGAQVLIERGVRLVGIDYLSIAPFHNSKETHEALLGAGMVILEGLDLSAVKQGMYQLYCLPLKLGGVEGAPARVILVGA